MLGSGALVVMAEGTDLLAAATNVLRFFRDESCGKCVPCRVGSTKAHTLLAQALAAGEGVDESLRARLLDLERGAAPDLHLRARPGGPRPRRQRAGSRTRRDGGAPPAARLRAIACPATSSSPRSPSRRRCTASGPPGAPPPRPWPLAEALHRVPAEAVTASSALPGFARATVDGFAVRAADTYGVSDGQPGYLDVNGTVAMGRAPTVAVVPGTAVAVPTGGALPRRGRRGRDGRAHPGGDAGHDRGRCTPSRPATGWSAPTRTPHRERCSRRRGAPCVPHDLGLLAAAGADRSSVSGPGRWSASCPPATRSSRRAPRPCCPARSATRRPSPWRRW